MLISKDGFKEMLTSKSSSNVILSSTLIMKKRFGISISKSLKGKEIDALPLIERNSGKTILDDDWTIQYNGEHPDLENLKNILTQNLNSYHEIKLNDYSKINQGRFLSIYFLYSPHILVLYLCVISVSYLCVVVFSCQDKF